jgi:hypothetical protein
MGWLVLLFCAVRREHKHSAEVAAWYQRLGEISTGEAADWAEKLWFVDYEIRRLPGVERREKRRECRTAAGTFVEVERGDAGWDFSKSGSHGTVETLEDIYELSSRMDLFCVEFNEYLTRTDNWLGGRDDGPRYYRGPYLRVLAFEPRNCDAEGSTEVV